MSRRALVNLLLLGLLALLGALAWLRPGQAPEGERHPPLTAIDPAGVRAIRVERSGQPAIVLRREDGHWLMQAPFRGRVDDARVRMLLRILAERSQRRVGGGDPARYGLAPPQATLTIDEARFEFGSAHPLEALRYVRTGDAVHLVVDATYHLLVGSGADLLDTALSRPDDPLVAVTLPGHALAKDDAGSWRDAGAVPLAAAGAAALADRWQTARALGVAPLRDAPALDEIVLRHASGAEIAYLILSPAPELVLGRADQGVEYRIAPTEAGPLLGISTAPGPDGDGNAAEH